MQIDFAIPPISHFRRWLGEFFSLFQSYEISITLSISSLGKSKTYFGISRQSLRNSSAPPRRASPEATRFALHWGTAIRCRLFCRHRLNSHLTTPHRRTPVSGRVSRPDLVPVSFSSFTFLREGITLQRSRQDGVAGTVT